MKSRERLLTAIRREEPDVVPVGLHAPETYWPYLKRVLGREINDYEALKMFGFDLSLYRSFVKGIEDPNWRVKSDILEDRVECKVTRFTMNTPKGKLSYIERQVPLMWHSEPLWYFSWKEPLLKNPEDLDRFAYKPADRPDVKKYEEEFRLFGNEAIVRSAIMHISDALTLRGREQICIDFYQRPDWVKSFFDLLTEKSLEYIEEAPSEYIDLMEIAGHIGTYISPPLYERFVFPYDCLVVKALHERGFYTTYHNCGRVMHLLESYVSTGTDCIETLTPPTHGGDVNLIEVKRRVGRKLCLMGGFDQSLLERGSKEEIDKEVKRCIDEAASSGGYILHTTDQFFMAPIENLHTMAKAAYLYGKHK